jgi:polyisoprenoid-binding protein YceI
VLKGQKAVKTVTLSFPTAKLDCANGTMNGHMMKALNATKHPNITFIMTGYELNAAAPVKGTLSGTLMINGVTKPITMPAEFVSGAAGALRATGKYVLTMTEWQVEPPKLMMGAMKVNPVITVNFDLLLQN